jgi:hypothetical protein
VPRGFDATDFAQRGDGAFGFDDQADELHHAAARLSDARFAHTARGAL